MSVATRALAAAEVRQSEAKLGIDEASSRLGAAEVAYNEQRPLLSDLCAKAGLAAEVPLTPEGQALSELAALTAIAQSARAAVATPLADARRLRTEIDGLQREHEALGAAIESSSRTIDDLRSGLHAVQLKANEHTVRGTDLAERLDSIDREINPFLAAADLTLEQLDANPEDVTARLAEVGREYQTLREQIGAFDQTLQRLAPERAAAVASRDHAQVQLTEAAALGSQRRSVLDDKSSARSQLLDGEATAPHRTRINEARRTAREALTTAHQSKSATAAAFQAAATRSEETAIALDAAKRRRGSAEEAFGAACQNIARAPEQVGAFIATDSAVRIALRARVQEIDRALSDATAAVQTRQNDLARTLEDFDETTDAEALRVAVAALAIEIGELHQKSGALSATLAQDDQARLTAAMLSVEIETARAELTIWQAVDDAIGSASGDRFRRFAQGITLDHLVQLANDHLNALSPRYRLVRGTAYDLTLHIIDREMADEIRATRSLSGGERFLVSLALALALSGLEGRSSFVDTLFIDEGFGSLGAETLDMAVDALETLQGRGQKVGVVTHVAAMIDRIAVQVRVEKRGAGRSEIRVADGLGSTWSVNGSAQ
jgi:DNA repair protein SbcC/Rad50